jgi:hypothetical protein
MGCAVPTNDVICLSLLRWDTIFQRPQHLLSRCARDRRVFFIEEPTFEPTIPHLSIEETEEGVQVVTPRLPEGLPGNSCEALQRELIDELMRGEQIDRPVLWFYSPLALAYTHHIDASAVVYDCMDALAPAAGVLHDREMLLLTAADVVFAARPSLHEARQLAHTDVHLFETPGPDDEDLWDDIWTEMWGLVEDHLEAPAGMLASYRRARQIGTLGRRATGAREAAGNRPGRT